MKLNAEWRVGPVRESVLIVDEGSCVRAAFEATPQRLSLLLTDPGDLALWQATGALTPQQQHPAWWGELVISRADSGEVLWIDPELFWDGILKWFRSRGVDYDSAPAAL